MYPFASLPDNLAAFCATLRREYGFRTGPGELIDAARALEYVPLADVAGVRHALRSILSGTRDDAELFDAAFDRFFLHGGAARVDAPALSGAQTRESAGATSRRRGRGDIQRYGIETSIEIDAELSHAASVDTVAEEKEADRQSKLVRSSYSPLEGEGSAPDLVPPDRAWRDAAAALVSRVHTGLSRRWRPAPHGERFDMRRTLRGSLHTGGELVIPRWRARPRRRPQFVVLVDGSRSMGAAATPALQVAVALASATARVEAFSFSTAISRTTRAVRRAAAGRPQRLQHLRHAWGGGTTIGACLREFRRRFGERLLGRDVLVIIASDGLDVGAPAVLHDAMAAVHRHSAGIVWLNPLLRTSGYEPTAVAMRMALPYVGSFAWVQTAADLATLARGLRLRQRAQVGRVFAATTP